jgi:hypothetical protein
LKQLHMMRRERAGFRAGDADDADRRPVAQQRDVEQAAEAAQPHYLSHLGIFGPFGLGVGDLDNFATADPVAAGRAGQRPGKRRLQRRIGLGT